MLRTVKKLITVVQALRRSRGLAGVLDKIADGREFARSLKGETMRSTPPRTTTHGKGDLERWFDNKTEGNGVVKWRHYFKIYEQHLQHFRNRPLCLMEIGIYSGGSLEMWRDYFGPQCSIIGIDIEEACRAYEKDGIRVVIGDQGNPSFWKSLQREGVTADVIIDDGGHRWDQQLCTLREAFQMLSPGGIFICEDIQGDNNQFLAFCSGLINEMSRYDETSSTQIRPTAFQKAVASIHFYPFVVVIQKNLDAVTNFASELRGTVWQPFLGLDSTLGKSL